MDYEKEREEYKLLDMQVIEFETEDVIATSCGTETPDF